MPKNLPLKPATFKFTDTPSSVARRRPITETDRETSSPVFTPNLSSASASPHLRPTNNLEMDSTNTDSQEKNQVEAEPPQTDGPSTTKTDSKTNTAEVGPKKVVCRKHPNGHSKSKKKAAAKKAKEVESSESDSSSSSSSDESDEDTESESDSDSEDEKLKRRKKKKAKAKKSKAKKKSKSRKKRAETSDEDSSEEGEETSAEEKPRKKKSKRASRKAREEEEEEEEETPEDRLASLQAQVAALSVANKRNLRIARLQQRRGNARVVDEDTSAREGKRDKTAKGKKKRASKVAFKRVDQLWDSSIHNYKLTETLDDPDANEWDQYIFTVRRKFDWENKYTETVVDIKSKPLKEALQHIMNDVKNVSLVSDTPVVDPNMLFLYLEESRAYMKELKAASKSEKKKKARKLAAAKVAHLKILIKYLDKDYAETKKTLYPLLANGTITFDLLWALYKPNDIAYTPTYSDPDEPRAFKIEYATKETHFMKGTWYSVEGRYLEYDGKSFGMGSLSVDVEQFKGPRKITSLSCYPLKYHKDQEALKLKLIERGKKFAALKGMNYRYHKGMAFFKKKRTVMKVNINGRVMVDPAIHRRINPNYPISTVKPKDPDDFEFEMYSDDDDESCCCGDSDEEDDLQQNEDKEDKVTRRLRVVKDKGGKHHVVEIDVDENGVEIQKEDMDKLAKEDEEEDKTKPEFTDEELLIASPVVLGFAFSEKLWLEFTVSGIHEVEWNESAFDSLVLPDNQKSIVKALVESHKFHAAENIDDVIQGKGKGLVAVLHGPPGTGKTLTAEGIAELLKCPLYMVSAGELGTDHRNLERDLQNILDIAHSWGAVLLLDEADVFLEKRTIHDIHRNALVSIFLRLLEYFQGILFLTTNRVETFDDAFQSRIHVALRYGELTMQAKKSVWKLFLEKVMAKEGIDCVKFKESDYDTMAKYVLNGRQIKNAVRTAQALAVNEKKALCMEHIKRVLLVAEAFDQDLKGGTGYQDAMRSYF